VTKSRDRSRFEVEKPLKILIVKVSSLGDVVHTLPVLYYLKSAHPGHTLDWIVEEPFSQVLVNHPLLHRLHLLHTKRWRKHPFESSGLRDVLRLHRAVRKERYDVVLDLQGNTKSGAVTLLTGAPSRFGFPASHVREWPNILATNRKIRPGSELLHITDRNLAVARAAFPGGSLPPPSGTLFSEESRRREVDEYFERHRLGDRPTAVFLYGASWKTKLWDRDHWKQLVASTVKDLGMDVLLTWASEEERAACIEIRGSWDGRVLLWPKSHLKTVLALLERAHLVVGGDTGLIHMAAAVGTPTVSLYFVTDGLRNGPRGPLHRCLQSSMPCSPCLKKGCGHRVECGRSIPVSAVLSAIGEVLDIRNSGGSRGSSPGTGI